MPINYSVTLVELQNLEKHDFWFQQYINFPKQNYSFYRIRTEVQRTDNYKWIN